MLVHIIDVCLALASLSDGTYEKKSANTSCVVVVYHVTIVAMDMGC